MTLSPLAFIERNILPFRRVLALRHRAILVALLLSAAPALPQPASVELSFSESPDGPGFDLVQTSGALRIGINQWPDGSGGGGPTSSAGVITADLNTGPNNWVFFAVIYDSALGSGQLKYFFGRPTHAAAMSTTHNYARGPVNTTGRLTVGNFGGVVSARNELGPGGGSRVSRGLIDELPVFSRGPFLRFSSRREFAWRFVVVPVTVLHSAEKGTRRASA